MKKAVLASAMLAMALVVSSCHTSVKGVVYCKEVVQADTSEVYDPVVHMYQTKIKPKAYYLCIKADTYTAKCSVDSATYNQYLIGDSVNFE